MKGFIDAIRKEPIASIVGLLIALFIGYFIYISRTMDKAPNEIVAPVMKAEKDLINWASSLKEKNQIKWDRQTDQNGNPIGPWFGKIQKGAVPDWVKNLLGPGEVEASASRLNENIRVSLLYSSPGWIGVTINLPSSKDGGSVSVSRLHRQ